MIRKYKNIIYFVSVLLIVIMAFGVSYSFFNYTRDVVVTDLEAGNISLTFTGNNTTITAANITSLSDEAGRVWSNYVDFDVVGVADTEDILYEIDLIPTGLTSANLSHVRVYLTNQSNNYIAGVAAYDELSDAKSGTGKSIYQKLDTGNANGTSKTTTDHYRLRVFFDEDYDISGLSNFSFNIYLHAENVENLPIQMMMKNADTTKVINFKTSAKTGDVGLSYENGIYRLPGTENDNFPIYYYRGDIDNNNVIFAGYCWQIIRTTDTGGTKMIYNGLPDISGSGNNMTYNCGTTRDFQNTVLSVTSLQQSTGYYYADDFEVVSTSGNGVTYRLKAGANPITQVAIANATAAAANIPTIVANYPYTCKETTDTATCIKLYKVDSYDSGTNAKVYSSGDRTTIGRGSYNTNYQNLADVGYMSNARYFGGSGYTSGALFATSATWNGTAYELTDASATTPYTGHHYSCDATTANATCTTVRYYYFYNTRLDRYEYISLTNGELVEDALYKMLGNGSNETKTKNAGYNLNLNDSNAKTAIESWFRTNLTNEVNVNNTDYSVYLEDTAYCNDRSYKTLGSGYTYAQSGWNPTNSGLLYFSFGTHNRYNNSWYSTSNVPAVNNVGEVPNIACPNETDRFTVSKSNGNGTLSYPVGLITADEIIMAGYGENSLASPVYYYLNTNDTYWTMSPYYYNGENAYVFIANNDLLKYSVVNINTVINNHGYRPVISLKLGTEFLKGDGTPTNPYIVKYN